MHDLPTGLSMKSSGLYVPFTRVVNKVSSKMGHPYGGVDYTDIYLLYICIADNPGRDIK
jgi:hypothetical protein